VLWVVHNLLKCCGPYIARAGSVGHSEAPVTTWRRNRIPCVSTIYVSMCTWPCIYIQVAGYSFADLLLRYVRVAVYPCARGRVSICTWLCIHVHLAVYPFACGHLSTCTRPVSTYKWSCIHVQNLVMRYVHVAVYPYKRGCISSCTWPCIHVRMDMYPRAYGHVSIWLCIHVHVVVYPQARGRVSTARGYVICEFGYALQAIMQNFVKHYGPQRRMLDHNAESHKLHLKVCPTLKQIVRHKIVYL
jgi:hypothetical protein